MPLVVCVIRLVVPVGAIVRQAMLRRPYFIMSSYNCASASFMRSRNGLSDSREASNTSNAPRSRAISIELRYALSASVLCTLTLKSVAS